MNTLSRSATMVVALLSLALVPARAPAQDTIRIATYNIKFFNAQVPAQRLDNLKQVIAALDADVIGLQEIADRDALKRLFDPAQWDIVIDDDSGDDQDVALVVRHPLTVQGLPQDLDADDAQFLFPGNALNREFPNRRDLLCVQVAVPGQTEPLHVMVHHAKSRRDGRDITDPRRDDAARAIVGVLEQRFDGQRFVIVGDFNDNPDDVSLNILETGQADATGGPEEIDGPFLVNLCEPLLAQDRASWGLRSSDVAGGTLNTIKPGTRKSNNEDRGTQGHSGPILFDQILIPMSMKGRYVPGSATIFDKAIAVSGGANSASDHVPVYADFVLSPSSDPPEPPEPPSPATGKVTIVELLPDPAGEDRGHEEVVLHNGGTSPVALAGWRLRDRSGNVFVLTGDVAAGTRITITLPAGQLPLNNDGDAVTLTDPQGATVHSVSYTAGQVGPGKRITFQ